MPTAAAHVASRVDPFFESGTNIASMLILYSGVAFLTMMAVLLARLAHRFMHTFHLEEDSEQD